MERIVTIIGGGLAGLSLGIALRTRGVPVILHEAGSYPRHRVCGEFISGVGEQTLARLGIADLLGDAYVHRTMAWFRKNRALFSGKIPSPALGISRHALDMRLSLRFQNLGGQLFEHSRLRAEEKEGVVWCTGRIPAKGGWLGLKCHTRDLDLAADLEMHLASNGYVGLGRIELDRVNVCGLFRLEPGRAGRGVETLQNYLCSGGLESLWNRMSVAGIVEGSFSGVSGFRMGWSSPQRDQLLLGDVGCMIPPFSGNGISMAFEAAEMALEPLFDWHKGTCVWKQALSRISHLLKTRFRSRVLAARIMHPFLTKERGQGFFAAVSQSGLLPYNRCFHLLRHS